MMAQICGLHDNTSLELKLLRGFIILFVSYTVI